MTMTLAFVDVETDGVHPDRQVWEIGIIRRDVDGTETEHHAFVDIDLGQTPDDFGIKVGKFYDHHPDGRWLSAPWAADVPNPASIEHRRAGLIAAPHQAARNVARITHDAVIVGANPGFDVESLERLLRASGLIPGWHYHPIDVRALAVGYLAARDIHVDLPWKAAVIAEHLGIPPILEEDLHTALGDARYAMRMYDAVTSGGAQVASEAPLAAPSTADGQTAASVDGGRQSGASAVGVGQ